MGGLGELITCVWAEGQFIEPRASIREVPFPLAWGMV
jgi:hypothetical protein